MLLNAFSMEYKIIRKYSDYSYLFENDLLLSSPECFLLFCSLGVLMYGCVNRLMYSNRCTEIDKFSPKLAVAVLPYSPNRAENHIQLVGVLVVLLTILLSFNRASFCAESGVSLFFNKLSFSSNDLLFCNLLLFCGLGSLLVSKNYLSSFSSSAISSDRLVEYITLILLCILSGILLLMCSDLVSVYLCIEMHSLCLYTLAGFPLCLNRTSSFSCESGLKYCILGSMSSGILVLGCCILYGTLGTTSLSEISRLLMCLFFNSYSNFVVSVPSILSDLIGVGFVLVLCGLLFKISSFPFHMWSPDVYEGANSSSTCIFAIVSKVSIIGLLVKLVSVCNLSSYHAFPSFCTLLCVCSLGSLLVGALGAINQNKMKRFLAWSSINHVGFLLMPLCTSSVLDECLNKDSNPILGMWERSCHWLSSSSISSVYLYLFVYVLMSCIQFGLLMIGLQRKRVFARKIGDINAVLKPSDLTLRYLSDLSFSGRTNILVSLVLSVTLFSVAGIPPLAGFFSKCSVLFSAIMNMSYGLATFGVLVSVMCCFYYLRIIKLMYFSASRVTGLTLLSVGKSNSFVLSFGTCLLIIFGLLLDDVSLCLYLAIGTA